MFYSILILAAAALTSAQNDSSSGTIGGYYSTSGPLAIDPNNVPIDLRQSWCTGQRNNCWKICGGADASLGDAFPNTCDETDLTFDCTCTNGASPNISDYSDTLPSYICQRWRDVCTAEHPNDLSGQTACQSVTCGERNASAQLNSDSSSDSSDSSSASPSSTPTSSSGAGGSSESASPSETSGGDAAEQSDNAAMTVGMNYGTGILMGGMLALFGLAL